MASRDQPTRRFAPVPVETTFQSVRASARQPCAVRPNAEPTPESSPRWASASPTLPDAVLNRRFKPQLVETSRRSHRAGHAGPATRPSDKTDITPYTNHIYLSKPRPRRNRHCSLHGPPNATLHDDTLDDESRLHMPPTRRETEDEGVQQYLLDLAAKHTSRQIQEAALAAFPNSRAREGGVAHFYYRESSDSDQSTHHHDSLLGRARPRRKSSNLGFNWWHKYMQDHADSLAHNSCHDASGDILKRSDSDLDKMELPVPPNPLWTTATPKFHAQQRYVSMEPMSSMSLYPAAQALDDKLPPTSCHAAPESYGLCAVSPSGPHVGDSPRDARRPAPFGVFGLEPEDAELRLMRQAASPPMLGKDLVFRQCPSPKQTKLETDHPFTTQGSSKQKNRDVTEQGGLWKGYCCRSESSDSCIVPAELHGAKMIVTPQPPGTPKESLGFESMSEGALSSASMSASSDSSSLSTTYGLWTSERRSRSGQAKGLHLLHGLDERLRREKAQAERLDKISLEFDDGFVTQVYNYLSLGYPATARTFDEELSKISRVAIEELSRDDEVRIAHGHVVDASLESLPEQDRCPRWRALKIYIMEWARQHPNLDSLDPLAWGVRERRGSWAI